MDPFPFNPDANYNGQANQLTPNIQIENLTLPDLMKNQHVQAMYKDWKDASNQVVQAAQMQQSLWQENTRLIAQVSSLQEKHRQDLYVIYNM